MGGHRGITMLREYRRGAANISFGSDIVTGFDTSWLTYVQAGDVLHVGDESMIISDITSHTSLVLTETWAGTSGNGLGYRIEISHDGLVRAKRLKVDWVHQERNKRRVASVIVFGRPWQADLHSQDLLNKAIGLAIAGVPLPAVWRDDENNDMPITGIEQLVAIGGAMAQQTENVYRRSWVLKAEIEAATSTEELRLIVW